MANTKNKENAVTDYMNMIEHSWTYERMTKKEQENCMQSFVVANEQEQIIGSYDQRWKICHAIYNAFLTALDYYDNPGDWRGTRTEEEVPLF